jgi:hypothetical protein
VARFYPARSWENPAATVDQFVTAVLIKWCRLLLPLPGADGVVDRILVAIVGVDRDDPV